jgi:hypothetical protein
MRVSGISNPEHTLLLIHSADFLRRAMAITPLKSRNHPWDEVVRVCQEYTLSGLKAIVEARGSRGSPFRFLYVSGDGTPRDGKKPSYMGDYLLMRVCEAFRVSRGLCILTMYQGDTELKVLAFGAEHRDSGLEVCVAKPGVIITPNDSVFRSAFATTARLAGFPKIKVSECAAAMIDQVIIGFEKDPLMNADLVRLGTKALGDDANL